MWQKVFENDAFCGIMHETAAEQKESGSPEVPAEIVILFILMNKSLQMDSNLATMEMSKSPAIGSSDQTKAAKHEPLVYRVEEIAQLLAISPRAAYNLCNTTKDFRVLRIGTSIRVNKQSFDNWFAAV